MHIYFNPQHPQLNSSVQDILRAFFGKITVVTKPEEANLQIEFRIEPMEMELTVAVTLRGARVAQTIENYQTTQELHSPELPNITRRLAKVAILEALQQLTGRNIGPWGILTGIRPTKIVHRLLDQGIVPEDINTILAQDYRVASEKRQLLLEVTLRQRGFFHTVDQLSQKVGIYIGIPFCPTRCAYCSFPAYALTKWQKLVPDFLQALLREIQVVGSALQAHGVQVEHIYIGGGTPTSLSATELEELLTVVNRSLVSPATIEFTVEAGRPDTLHLDKLQVMKQMGVGRISINPQSMNEQTLRAIGRDHTPQQVREKLQLAREVGFDNINMDLIIGLPGEGVQEVQKTLQELGQLQPENLTVHTLAIKRASELNQSGHQFDESAMEISTIMLSEVYQFAADQGLVPYYLYRQKQMLGSLENVGFALPGRECIYNIQMMEERQTIIGLGVGSGSKWVQKDLTLENTYNPKDIINYCQRIEELANKKQYSIQQWSETSNS